MKTAKVTIAGSYRKHLERILEAKQRFEALGAEVLRPRASTAVAVSDADAELIRLEGDPEERRALRAAQFAAIAGSDLVYVVNPGGYVGGAATLEVGYAHRGESLIAASEAPFEADVADVVTIIGSPEEALQELRRRDRG